MTANGADISIEERARISRGTSGHAIYRMAASIVRHRHPKGGRLYDVGCGAGLFRNTAQPLCDEYRGVDVVRYEGYPADAPFAQVNLDHPRWLLDDGVADVAISIETIEHLENPRAFVRELTRITKPGGLVVVTTPNQLSLLSKLTLVVKDQFVNFQASSYPAHLTALLEVDLQRIAAECGLQDVEIAYTNEGRIPGTSAHWPAVCGGRMFSDNIAMSARRPARG